MQHSNDTPKFPHNIPLGIVPRIIQLVLATLPERTNPKQDEPTDDDRG